MDKKNVQNLGVRKIHADNHHSGIFSFGTLSLSSSTAKKEEGRF